MEAEYWKKCSACKKEIGYLTRYFVCSVSTCNQKRTGLNFCSVSCFEQHLPSARHKDAAAYENKSPSFQEAQREENGGANVKRIMTNSMPSASSRASIPKEVLIIASKLKDYIRARSEMNTSAQVMDILSDIVRRHCDDAIDKARAEGRKTVLDRDFKHY